MKSTFAFLLTFLLLISCKEKETELVDLSDIVESSDKYKEGETQDQDTLIVHLYDSLSIENQRISDTLGLSRENIEWIDSLWLPDRFAHQKMQKWSGEIAGNSAQIAVWSYADSLTLKNALFNWWDCYGKRCNSLQLWEEKKLSSESLLFFVMDKKVIFLSVKGAIQEKKLLENLQKIFPKSEHKYVLTQQAGKKTRWWKLEDKKWSVIEKEEI